ncbi:MAG: hypothetical protein ABFC73_14450 [Clostridiaceae bacterium]
MTQFNLETMWDVRDQLVEELKVRGLLPERSLYIRREDGGVFALSIRKQTPRVLSFDWEGTECRYRTLERVSISLTEYDVAPGGFGGMFGLGEKGAHGWMFSVLEAGTLVWQTPVLPGMTAIADLFFREDRFLNGRRKKGTVPHWQLCPEDAERCEEIFSVWDKLLQEAADGC